MAYDASKEKREVFATIEKGAKTRIEVAKITQETGEKVIDVRKVVLPKDSTEWTLTPKGIRFDIKDAEAVIKGIEEAIKE